MSAQTSADDRARQEAADWFARLNTKTITTAELRAFRAWRAIRANSEAYADVEAVWKAAEHLRHDPDIGDMVRTALSLAYLHPAFHQGHLDGTPVAAHVEPGADGADFGAIGPDGERPRRVVRHVKKGLTP